MIDLLIAFYIGAIVGGFAGAIFMGLLVAGADADRKANELWG